MNMQCTGWTMTKNRKGFIRLFRRSGNWKEDRKKQNMQKKMV
jgi:hypothetical protein